MDKKLVHPRLFALSHSRSVPSYDLWTFSKCQIVFDLSLNLSRSALCIFLCQIPRYFAVTICLLWGFSRCCSSKLGAHGFRSWGSPFWIMPRDCLFLSRILFCTWCILRISWCVPKKRSIPIPQLSEEQNSLDLNFEIHNLGLFFPSE